MTDKFKQAEAEYFRLRGKFSTGRLTRAEFDLALRELMVQDAQGRYWTIAADTGKWYVHDGQKWIEAVPPSSAPERASASLPERSVPAKPTATSAQGINQKLLFAFAGGLSIIFLIILGAIFLLPRSTPTPVVAIVPSPSATLAETPRLPSTTPTPALVSSNVPGIQVSIIPVASPSPIAAKDFAARNASLGGKIAALNEAELKFIRDMRANAFDGRIAGLAFPPFQKISPVADANLKDIAAKGMDVGLLAGQLSQVAVKQDKGSAQAAQSADAYNTIARNAFALVIDAQNVRTGLQNGSLPGAQAINTIASYGAQLWNNSVTDGNTKSNPFSAQATNAEPIPALNPNVAAQAQTQINANNSAIWIAQSASKTARTLDVPAAKSPVSNPFDPQVLNSLTTANGQSDGNKAQQVAAANLETLGATSTSTDPSTPKRIQVPINPVAVSGSDQIKAGNLPTFPAGSATVVTKNNPSDDNPFLQSLGLNGNQPPTDQGKTTVDDAPALINLSLTGITLDQINKLAPGSGTFEADVNFSFTVNWNTTLAAPQFSLSCVSGNNYILTKASGLMQLRGKGLLILYPGTLDVYCYATSAGSGNTLGSVSEHILVGDAAGATQRAIQVETDLANLNAQLTAEALGTLNKQKTQAAGTAQVIATQHALETEVAASQATEFRLTAAAFATRQAQQQLSATPTRTPTFAPKVVDTLSHPGNVEAVSTHVVLQRGRLYRFTFSGRVNVINPARSLSAGQLPDKVNGIAVPASGVLVIEGTGSVATISCGHEVPDPKDPGAYGIVVEDLGPL